MWEPVSKKGFFWGGDSHPPKWGGYRKGGLSSLPGGTYAPGGEFKSPTYYTPGFAREPVAQQ